MSIVRPNFPDIKEITKYQQQVFIDVPRMRTQVTRTSGKMLDHLPNCRLMILIEYKNLSSNVYTKYPR